MKVVYSWLQEFIELPEGIDEVCRLLTFSGLEVEEYETLGPKGDWSGLVVAEVLEKWKHPNADKLSVTRVNAGDSGTFQVVCGAQNVAVGQKVVLATVGTTLQPIKGESFQIKSSKIRGELSDGMLCAEDEIGYGSGHDGIMVLPAEAKPGTPISEVLKPERDFIIHIGLTANRGDATSHLGVARELSALLNRDMDMSWPECKSGNQPAAITVKIENPADCGRYSGWEMTHVKVAESPQWLKKKLEKLGIRSINNLVDISNYVMHHTGQPIHIFDADKIGGNAVNIRRAFDGEKFVTLDGVEHALHPDLNLVIADAEKPMALAGVFGGLLSGVSVDTKRIFIESAWFNQAIIRKSARSKAYNTDASFRYERGTDPEITLKALHLTASLIQEIAGGEVAGVPIDLYPGKPEDKIVQLPFSLITRIAGQEIPTADAEAICVRLGLEIIAKNEMGWTFQVPHFKPDVYRPIDIVEEIMRIYGYNRIEIPSYIRYSPDNALPDARIGLREHIADILKASGYLEIATNTLSQPALYQGFDEQEFVKILNPLSGDLSIMRPTATYAGLETVAFNKRRHHHNLRLFEFGKSYHKRSEEYGEEEFLNIWLTGKFPADHWRHKAEEADFYMTKGIVEKLVFHMGLEIDNFPMSTGKFSKNPDRDNPLFIGSISAKALQDFDINAPVWVASMHWKTFADAAVNKEFVLKPVSKFPEVRRDLSLVLDKKVSYFDLKKIANSTLGEMLSEIQLFDVYEGDRIEQGKKAYAMRFTLHNLEKTLTDAEIEERMTKLENAFVKDVGAYLRK